jgi:predicted MFS family arabinose efflux permease
MTACRARIFRYFILELWIVRRLRLRARERMGRSQGRERRYTIIYMVPVPRHPLARILALNRTVAIVLVTVFFFGLGEQLWRDFMPVYLRAQHQPRLPQEITWAALWSVGLLGFLVNLFEAFCYIGGGQLTARLGDRGSLILFASLAISGYVLFLAAPVLPVPSAWLDGIAVLAAVLIIGWEPLSVPVTFTTVGATVAADKQGMAFAIQSIQKRLPKILGPALAGLVLGAADRYWGSPVAGTIHGMRWLVAAALAMGLVSLVIQIVWMPHREPPPPGPPASHILRHMHPTLRRLLLAEIFTRWCDWLVRDFVILYILLEHGVSKEAAGGLLALQHLTALLTYLPVGGLTSRVGLQPFVGLTLVFFALFPLTLALTPGPSWLFVPFIVYGLREIGEPARKAMITSLFPEAVRARGVGLYWGIRSFAMCSASLVGAWTWAELGPRRLLLLAAALGAAGAGVFYFLVRQRESTGTIPESSSTTRIPR